MSEDIGNEHAPLASIRRHGSYLIAEPRGPWLQPFCVSRIAGQDGGRYGHSVERESVPLFRPVKLADDRLAVQLWPGLLTLARAAMEAQGLQVEVTTPPLSRLHMVSPFQLVSAGLLQFVTQNERGVIRPDLAAGVDVVALVAQVILAFPAARVVILVADCAPEWVRNLRRLVSDVGVSTYRTPYSGGNRVVVATPGALGTVNIGRADIVFVTAPLARMRDDPLLAKYPAPPPDPDVFAKVNQMERLADVRGRLFAVLPRGYCPSRYEAARLAQQFGVEEYVAAGGARTERPVRVVWEGMTGGPAVAAGDTPLAVKRTAVWSNPVLTRRAAAIARVLADGNRDALRRKFPGVEPGLQRHGAHRVLVLVEGPDHADALAATLKGWPVVTADAPAEIDNSPPPPAGVIATARGAARLCGDFDAVVRLDLGQGMPPLPLPGWLDTAEADPAPLLVIDFDLRCHPLLRQWARNRRAAYLRAGWRDPAQNPGAAALARFVALTSNRRART